MQPPLNSDIPLESQSGIDYHPLRNLLQTGRWREADAETYWLMQEILGEDSSIHGHDLYDFPCTDLRTMDRLWVQYSQGRFGFSVQKTIYLECGALLDGQYPGDKIWREFCDRIGWRFNHRYLDYSEAKFRITAPQGHLPAKLGLLTFAGTCVLTLRMKTCGL